MGVCVFSGDKPYSCDICQKKFALGCNLRAHLRTHEAEYQSSPASLELYRRTLEMLAAQDAANDGSAKEDNSNSSSPTRESHDDEEEEELDMEDVEEDDVATSSSPPKEAAAAAAGQLIQDLPKLAAAVQAV